MFAQLSGGKLVEVVSSLTLVVFKQKLGTHASCPEYICDGSSNTGVMDWINHNSKHTLGAYYMTSTIININVGYYFYISILLHPESESESHSVVSNSLQPHRLYSPCNSPGHNTGVGSCSLLQGIIPTQRLNPGLQHCRWILYQLSHRGSTRILEWVAYPFSRGSSSPRNQTRVSCIAGRFFTS